MPFLPIFAFAAVDAPPPRVAAIAAPAPLSCLPAAAIRGTKVVALSVYSSGGRNMPFMLAGSRLPVHRLTVKGEASDPVILVVTAYEPILWDMSAIQGRVKAVVASGYYPQAVTGLPADTPVRFSSSVGNFSGSETCARIRYAYEQTGEIESMAKDIKRAIGVAPRQFYGAYSAERLDIDGPRGSDVGLPELSDIRASVPLITEDDPASTEKMRALPPADELAAEGPKLRVVEWDESGAIVRDEGSPPRSENKVNAPVASPSPDPAPFSTFTSAGWILWLGAIAFVAWFWRRSASHSRQEPKPLPAPAGKKNSPIAAKSPAEAHAAFVQKQLAELTTLAAITDSEPLVVALHRYGKEVQNLSRTRFDTDLADEIAAIVNRHFAHAVASYRQVRSSLEGVEGDRADQTLLHAIDRLATRLQELHSTQHSRDVASVDEAARFIEARHPA